MIVSQRVYTEIINNILASFIIFRTFFFFWNSIQWKEYMYLTTVLRIVGCKQAGLSSGWSYPSPQWDYW